MTKDKQTRENTSKLHLQNPNPNFAIPSFCDVWLPWVNQHLHWYMVGLHLTMVKISHPKTKPGYMSPNLTFPGLNKYGHYLKGPTQGGEDKSVGAGSHFTLAMFASG
jgi:hypothetical protein